jgi:hypothetical protein
MSSTSLYLRNLITETTFIRPPPNSIRLYRAFHNVLHDYKHFSQENQRIYLNGIVHSHRKLKKCFTNSDVQCVHHSFTAAMIHVFRSARLCGNEEYRCTHVDARGKNLNIVSMCAVLPMVHTSNISSC